MYYVYEHKALEVLVVMTHDPENWWRLWPGQFPRQKPCVTVCPPCSSRSSRHCYLGELVHGTNSKH